jgi:undecaprenyl-diphosphatase
MIGKIVNLKTVRQWFFVGLAFLLSGVFLQIANQTSLGTWLELDNGILVSVSSLRSPTLNNTAIELSALASFTVLTIFLLIIMMIMFFNRNRVGLLHAFIAFTGTGILQAWTKTLYDRPRPSVVEHLVHVESTSFPSGHSFAAAAIYTTLALIGAEYFKNHWQRVLIFSFAAVLIFLIGFSRIFLGVHYPTDVVSGICIGSAWAYLVGAGVNWYNGRARSHKKN